MLDDLYQRRTRALFDRSARLAAAAGLTPNRVTLLGFALSSLNSGLFLLHERPAAYGLALAATEMLDNLDGALARLTGTASAYGSYLDATTDRYKELFSLLAVGAVSGHWPLAALAVGGSLLVSYNHARAAMEGAPAASGRDLMGRFERVATLCLGLVLAPFVPARFCFGTDTVFLALLAIAVFAHLTALQRFLRARRALLSP